MNENVLLVIVLLPMLSLSGCIEKNYNAIEIEGEVAGMYEAASAGGARLMIMDMHTYEMPLGDPESDYDLITVGMILQNELPEGSILINPDSFKLEDRDGRIYSITPDGSKFLKNPLQSSELLPGEIIWGAIGFEIRAEARPKLLRLVGSDGDYLLDVRLDSLVIPPADLHSPLDPVAGKDCVVTITGISESKKNSKSCLRIDYALRNSGSRALMLDGRGYGKFADLIDTNGMSYSAYTYSTEGPVIPPGGGIEGQLFYRIPEDVIPGYLIFWPPDEDAIVFDLRSDHT